MAITIPPDKNTAAEHRPKAFAASGSISAPVASWIVWGVWAIMVLALFRFVGEFGSNCLFQDEWSQVPLLTHNRTLSLSALWAQHNEHRIFLPRLLIIALFQVSGHDFRAGMWFDVLALAATAALLIAAAKKARGRTSPVDAFMPLVVLNWGQYENLLWSFQVGFVVPTLLASVLAYTMIAISRPLTVGRALLIAMVLVLMVLCGAVGPAYAVPMGLWLGYAAVESYVSDSPSSKTYGFVIGMLFLGTLLLPVIYFHGFTKPGQHPPSPSPTASIRVALEFLTMSLGPTFATVAWPVSGALVASLVLASGLRLSNVAMSNPLERTRALGLLALLASVCLTAAGVGYGRAGLGAHAGFPSRYVTLAIPALVCIYLSWVVYGGVFSRYCVPIGLCCLVGVLLRPNAKAARRYANALRPRFVLLEHDILAGMPRSELAKKHTQPTGVFMDPNSAKQMAEWLGMLKNARIGVFRHVQDDPEESKDGANH